MRQQRKGMMRAFACMVVLVGLLLGASRSFGDSAEPLYPIFEGGLWGLIDPSGRVVLEPKFEQIGRGGNTWIPETWNSANPPAQVLVEMTLTNGTPVKDRVIPVRLAGKLALATRDGKILVHGEYEQMAGAFSDGLLKVKSGGRYGFVDEEGNLVLPARWEQAHGFKQGHAFIRDEGRWGIIDRNGKVVVAPRWDAIGHVTWKWVTVRQGTDWGVVDSTGKVVVPVQYDDIQSTPMEPLMPVRDDGRILYVRPDGTGTVAFEFLCPKKKHRKKANAFGFFENHAAVVWCGDKEGVIDESGTFVLEPEWETIHNFTNGRALVRHKGKEGMIDETGKFVIPLQRNLDLRGVGEDEISFSRDGEHGFYDREGRVIRTFTVDADRVASFRDGLAVATRRFEDGYVKDGYIDTSGNWVIKPRFYRAQPFNGPLAAVQQPVTRDLLEVGYINREGKAVYKVRLGGFIWPDLVDPAGISEPQ